MTFQERLKAVELLWSSISRTPDAVESPEWQQDVLAQRLQTIADGKAEFLSVDEVRRVFGR